LLAKRKQAVTIVEGFMDFLILTMQKRKLPSLSFRQQHLFLISTPDILITIIMPNYPNGTDIRNAPILVPGDWLLYQTPIYQSTSHQAQESIMMFIILLIVS
jgi:hypothetical protein